MKHRVILLAALALIPVNMAFAQHDRMDMNGMDMGSMDMSGMNAKAATHEGVGVVKNVDQAKGVVTLSHEPIASLNWPAMTMDFGVTDKALFKKLVKGDKVSFQFVKQGNRYLLTGAK